MWVPTWRAYVLKHSLSSWTTATDTFILFFFCSRRKRAQRRTQEVSESSSNCCQEPCAGELVRQLQVDPRKKLFTLKVFLLQCRLFFCRIHFFEPPAHIVYVKPLKRDLFKRRLCCIFNPARSSGCRGADLTTGGPKGRGER